MTNLFMPLFFVAGSLLTSCTSAVFSPTPSANPWDDNYLSVAKMEDYRQWGTYNVHDPSCRKLGDYYYMYSTDAIFGENRKEAEEKGVPLGYIQMRRSKDLVHWEFLGWAFPEIPEEAVQWVQTHADGKGATISGPLISFPTKTNTVSTIVSPLSDARLRISDLLNPTPPKVLGHK